MKNRLPKFWLIACLCWPMAAHATTVNSHDTATLTVSQDDETIDVTGAGHLDVDTVGANAPALTSDASFARTIINVNTTDPSASITATGSSFGAVSFTGAGASLSSLDITSGTIKSSVTGAGDASVFLAGGVTSVPVISVSASGTISNDTNGGYAVNSNNSNNTDLSITNAGTISAANHATSVAINMNDGNGGSTFTLNNAGTITAGASGTAIQLVGAVADMTNTGTITGGISFGSSVGSTLSMDNGTITGDVTMNHASQQVSYNGGALTGNIIGPGVVNVTSATTATSEGNVGTSGHSLTSLNIASDATLDMTTNNNDLYATAVNLGDNAALWVGSGAFSAGGVNGTADNQGTLYFGANNSLANAVGASHRVNVFDVGTGATVVAATHNITTERLVLDGTGILTATTGVITANDVTINQGTLTIGAGGLNVTTTTTLANGAIMNIGAGGYTGAIDGFHATRGTVNFTATQSTGGIIGATHLVVAINVPDAVTLTVDDNIAATTITVGGGATGVLDHTAGNMNGAVHLATGSTVNLTGGNILGVATGTGGAATVNLDGTASAVQLDCGCFNVLTFGAGNDVLTIKGDVTVGGDITGGNGTDTLTIGSLTDTTTLHMDSNTLSGFETVTIQGDTVVNAMVDMTGVNVAADGNFHINGDFAADSVTVNNGGEFGGNTDFTGDLIVNSGGTVAPGNSVGTINVIGNVTFNSGSTYQVEVDAGGVDRLNATGDITIDPNVTLELVPLGTFAGSTATFLHADGNLIGTFDNLITNGVAATISYSATEGTLNFSILTASPAVTNAQASSSFDSAALFTDSVLGSAADNAFTRRPSYWLQGLYRGINRDTDGNFTGYSNSIKGAVGGAESAVASNYKVGLSIAALTNDSQLDNDIGENDGNASFLSAYGTYANAASPLQFFATLGATAGYHGFDNTRRVSNSGTVSYAQSSNDAYEAGVLAQIGIRKDLYNSGWMAVPSVGLEYIHIFAEGYSESDGGAANISVGDYDFGTMRTSANLEIAQKKGYQLGSSGVIARPAVNLGVFHEAAVTDRRITGNFSTGTGFSIDLDDASRIYATAGAGVDFTFQNGWTAFVNYQHVEGGDETRNEGRLGARVEF